MGRRWNETMPPAVRGRASASVTNRWCSANATSRAIMTSAFLGPPRVTRAGGPGSGLGSRRRGRRRFSEGRWSGARRRAGGGGGADGERRLGGLGGLEPREDLAGGARRRRRRRQVGDRGADEQDDVVVVAVVPEARDPRRVGRARLRQRRQAGHGQDEEQGDEGAGPHASASAGARSWPPPSHA